MCIWYNRLRYIDAVSAGKNAIVSIHYQTNPSPMISIFLLHRHASSIRVADAHTHLETNWSAAKGYNIANLRPYIKK